MEVHVGDCEEHTGDFFAVNDRLVLHGAFDSITESRKFVARIGNDSRRVLALERQLRMARPLVP